MYKIIKRIFQIKKKPKDLWKDNISEYQVIPIHIILNFYN
jgi:hypothetical protein